MKIAVLGAGAIGSLIGSYLSKQNDVVLVGKKRFVENVKKQGLILEGLTKEVNFEVCVAEKLEEKFELIILTVKAFDTESAIRSNHLRIKDSYLLTMQNGLDNVEIIKNYKNSRLLAGITTQAAYSQDYGKIVHTGLGTTKLGAITSDSENFAKELVKNFNDVGLKTEYSKNIMNDIWIKGAINACINPITAVLNIQNGQILESEFTEELLVDMARECGKVIEKKGINIDLLDEVKRVIIATKDNYSSMLQDLQKGRSTEIDHITKIVIEESLKYKTDIPINRVLYNLVKFVETRKKSLNKTQ